MRKNVVHTLDAWLWRHGFQNPEIRAVALAELLFAGCCLLGGVLAWNWTTWPLWFSSGAAVFTWCFCGQARHLLGLQLTAYSTALFLVILLRFGARLLIVAVLLYLALTVCSAPAAALVGGVVAGTLVALGTYALVGFAGHN